MSTLSVPVDERVGSNTIAITCKSSNKVVQSFYTLLLSSHLARPVIPNVVLLKSYLGTTLAAKSDPPRPLLAAKFVPPRQLAKTGPPLPNTVPSSRQWFCFLVQCSTVKWKVLLVV